MWCKDVQSAAFNWSPSQHVKYLCVKYLGSFSCTAGERRRNKTNVFFFSCFSHRARSISLKGQLGKKKKMCFLSFLVHDDGLKLWPGPVAMEMTPEHSASSSCRSVKCEFEFPEGFLSAEDFDSPRSVIPRGSCLTIVAILLFIWPFSFFRARY